MVPLQNHATMSTPQIVLIKKLLSFCLRGAGSTTWLYFVIVCQPVCSTEAKQNNTRFVPSIYTSRTDREPWPHFHECINYSIFFPFRPRWPSLLLLLRPPGRETKPCPYLFNIALFFLLFPSLAATGYDAVLFSTSAAPTEEGKSSIPRLAIRRCPAESPEPDSGPPPTNHGQHLHTISSAHTTGGLFTSWCKFLS